MALKARYSLLNQVSLQNLSNTYVTLSPRDRLIFIGAAVGVVVLLVFLPVSLLSGKIRSLQNEVSSSQETLQKISSNIQEYKELQSTVKSLKRKLGSGVTNPMSKIEEIATQSNIRENVDSLTMAPSIDTDFFDGDVVSLTLKKVTLPQLVSFLYNVENNKKGVMKIMRLEMKSLYSNRALLNVTCQIASLSLKEEL
jgi:type II secretory pathway component PulM